MKNDSDSKNIEEYNQTNNLKNNSKSNSNTFSENYFSSSNSNNINNNNDNVNSDDNENDNDNDVDNEINHNIINLQSMSSDNSDHLAIIKLNKKFFTFDKKSYPEILKNKISKQEWEEIAVEATRIIGTAYGLKKDQENVFVPKWMNFITNLSLILIIVSNLLLLIYGKEKTNNIIIYIIAVIIIILVIFVNVLLIYYNGMRELEKEENLAYFINKEFVVYLKDLNKRYKNKAIFKYNDKKTQLECELLI